MIVIEPLRYKSSYEIDEISKLIKKILNEFYNNAFEKDILEYILNFVESDIIKNEIKIDKAQYFFIKFKQKNIGFFKLDIKNNNLYIAKIYLLKEFRFKGFGKQVFSIIKELALKDKLNKIVVFIEETNKVAIKVFKNWGFTKEADIVKYIGSNYYIYGSFFEYKFNKTKSL